MRLPASGCADSFEHFHRIKGFRGMNVLIAALEARDAALKPAIDKQEQAA